MTNLLISLIALTLSAVGGFDVVCKIVQKLTGCGAEQAAEMVRNAITGKITIPLENDSGFYLELCQALKNIIGDKRYAELEKLDAALRAAGQAPVIACGANGGLPYFAISVRPKDNTEKQMIEVVLTGITKKHLVSRGLGPEVLRDWKARMDIDSPYLEIRYPNNAQDRKLIVDTIAREGIDVMDAYRPLTDDTEADDLTDG